MDFVSLKKFDQLVFQPLWLKIMFPFFFIKRPFSWFQKAMEVSFFKDILQPANTRIIYNDKQTGSISNFSWNWKKIQEKRSKLITKSDVFLVMV